ncbi:MAG: MFS transporter [Rubrivivax sp.]
MPDDRPPPAAAPLPALLPALLLAAVAAGFEAGAIGFVLPALRRDTGASAQQASWLLSVFVAATLLSVPACALAARRLGAARLLRGCLALAVLAGALASVLPGLPAVLAARALMGLAHGPLLPLAAAVVVLHAPPQRHGRLLGLVSLSYGLSFVAATIGTPWLLLPGWRGAFVLGTALALLAWLVPLPASPPTAAAAAPAPPRWPQALGRPLRAVLLLALGTGIGQAALVWLPTLAVTRLQIGMTQAAPLMVPMLLGGLLATAGVMRWLDRLGPRPLVWAGGAVALAGLALAVAAPPGALAFMAGSAGMGLGIGLLSGGPLRYAAARALPPAAQGLAQGAVAWVTDLGLLAGTLLLGRLLAHGGDAAPPVEAALAWTGAAMALCLPAALALQGRGQAVREVTR